VPQPSSEKNQEVAEERKPVSILQKEVQMAPDSKPTACAEKVIPVLMPQAGQTMEEGTLLAWKVE